MTDGNAQLLKNARTKLSARYLTALRTHLGKKNPGNGNRAQGLGRAKRTVLFRVAQEALTNVARHAHASQVKMSLSKISGAIRMEISDNGQSFHVEKTLLAKNPKRLGLIGMKERVEMVGGNLTIESAPGKGTTVRAEIPFNQEKTKN